MENSTLQSGVKIRALMLFLSLLFSLNSMAQTISVTGKVLDAKTGEAIIGATVKEKGTQKGAVTDVNGTFNLNVASSAVLQVSYIGYATMETPATGGKPLIIKLIRGNNDLNEVIVVGYGTQKKPTITGAVEVVTAKAFEDRAVTNVGLSLQGQTPGLLVTRSSPRPGNEGLAFQIRGATSVNGGSPLIVVDGVPVINYQSFQNMNPDDIESISVLKDASASIYGANGANGVILVTTKKGKGRNGSPKVDYTGNLRFTTDGIKGYSASAQQYAQIWLDANKEETTPNWWGWDTQANMQKLANGYEGIITTRYWGDAYVGKGNRIDEMFARRYSYQHNLSIANNTDRTSYRISAGYADNQATLATAYDGQKQYNFRLNYEYKLSDRIKLTTDYSFIDAKTSSPSVGLGSNLYANDMPFWPAKNPYGEWNANFGNVGNRNAAATTADGGRNNINDFTNRLDLAATIGIVKNLDFIGTVNFQDEQYRQEIYHTPVQLYDWYGNKSQEANQETTQSTGNPGYVTTSNHVFSQYYSALLKYGKSIGSHNFSATGGIEAKKYNYQNLSARRIYFTDNGVEDLNLADPTVQDNSGGKGHSGTYSYLLRANYNYAEKYLLELLGRDDGASNFAPGYQFIKYGGGSLGWAFTKEDFLKGITSIVNFGKVRASYGISGNNAGVGAYNYLVGVNNGTAVLGNPPAKQTTSYLSNNDIFSNTTTWESVSQKDIGIDLNFLNNRLSTTYDYYIKENNHMLQSTQRPALLGGSSPLTNSGQLSVKGWEFTIGWNDHAGDFNYNVRLNIGNSKSLLKKLENADAYSAGKNNFVNGYPLHSWFLQKTGGYFQSQAEVDAYYAKYGAGGGLISRVPPSGSSALRPGDTKIIDVNGDGILSNGGGNVNGNTSDLVYMGDGDAHYQFGINLGGSWKGLDFNAFFQGVGKQLIMRQGYLAYPFATIYTNQPTSFEGKTWTTDHTDAPFPRLTVDQNRAAWNYQNNDFMLQNSRYIRLKSLVVGYTLPSNWTKRAKLNRVRIYFSGNDLWESTSIKDGYDPEMGETSQNVGYPFYRTWSFGLNVGL
ncbi:SusC/RagA family TonB-linked outer membrane protein [Mucilaginibacter dorajii]|nr:SusC/RagA family TonB-linked outer membrane protein [Mucilaginibacter dorajii]MCS3732281.1 TonB-linked SusC/RagA family outer membrane protein [Mucilaginibacter dorajii]